jgi:hypothetical protein
MAEAGGLAGAARQKYASNRPAGPEVPSSPISSREPMPPRYTVRLMFEWRGGSLWCGNDAALHAFGVGDIEDLLPLSAETRRRLEELSVWHDTSLNWEYPPDPGPWTPEEQERFDRAAREMLQTLRAELGSDFEVVYQGL